VLAKTVYIDDQGTVVTKTEFDNVGASLARVSDSHVLFVKL